MKLTVTVRHVTDGPREQNRIRGTGELLAESTDLGFASAHVFHERLAPGRRSSSPHWHTQREELIYVLRGTPTLIVDQQVRRLSVGDYVRFPPGLPEPHHLRNDSDDDVDYLVIASSAADDEVKY